MPSFRESWSKWRSRANRTVPAPRQGMTWLVLGTLALLFTAMDPAFGWIGFVVLPLFLIVVAIDYVQIRRAYIESIQRTFGSTPQIGLPLAVQVRVMLRGAGHRAPDGPSLVLRNLRFDFGEPETMAFSKPLERVTVNDNLDAKSAVLQKSAMLQELLFEGEVIPHRRGNWTFGPVDCQYSSPLGLWTRMQRSAQGTVTVLVLPDVTSWRDTVASLRQTLFQEGRHVKRLASGDTDFAYISEYGFDDDLRNVNWAATARRARLMKNVYEPERGQHIILAIDASRYMSVELPNGKTRLDCAIDSAAALAHTAIQMGDSVGILGFTSEITLRLGPDKGAHYYRSAIQSLAALEAQPVQGGYQALFASLSGRLRRRSLLIVLSEMEGLSTDAGFLPAIQAMRQRHPTLFVTLSPLHLQQLLEHPPETEKDVAEWAATEWLLEERDELTEQLRRGGVELIEAPPNHLVTRVVSSYLQKKRRGTL